MGDRYLIRLDPKRRARWEAARGHEPLASWIKRVCDEKAERDARRVGGESEEDGVAQQ